MSMADHSEGEAPETAENGKESAGRNGGGDSAGGSYPNPHSGKKPRNGGFMGHGGQSEMAYHGHSQLGDKDLGSNPNSPAKSKPD
jgi:hypothetical protein